MTNSDPAEIVKAYAAETGRNLLMASPSAGPVFALRIDPDRTVTRIATPFRGTDATAALGGIDVFSCPDRAHVGAVGEYSFGVEPSNQLAWCCYGRSMLHGSVFLWHDNGGPVDPGLVEMIESAAIAPANRAVEIAANYWGIV